MRWVAFVARLIDRYLETALESNGLFLLQPQHCVAAQEELSLDVWLVFRSHTCFRPFSRDGLSFDVTLVSPRCNIPLCSQSRWSYNRRDPTQLLMPKRIATRAVTTKSCVTTACSIVGTTGCIKLQSSRAELGALAKGHVTN